MPSPFPGMDPFLEDPEFFPDLHDSLITYIREAIQAKLPAPYFAVIGSRLWLEFTERSVEPDVLSRLSPPLSPEQAAWAEQVLQEARRGAPS